LTKFIANILYIKYLKKANSYKIIAISLLATYNVLPETNPVFGCDV
jgi:hypothetical protein